MLGAMLSRRKRVSMFVAKLGCVRKTAAGTHGFTVLLQLRAAEYVIVHGQTSTSYHKQLALEGAMQSLGPGRLLLDIHMIPGL
jgi:hypothetical protein